ncbi:hypothetical protein ILUMI_17701 [Ignelater luminosus]|uniref:SLC26A/SulP transporter domain-containing protein n=1 Tax=Ignelater luminosus TaxID=2038154 RepID=A0A8K0CJE0_IGNLU|nr:hypothetical protein ILUMI_17701 [Ignelater luminosus]
MVLLALSFLTPYFAFIPKSSLAAVIICAVIFMIEYEVVQPMWRSNKKDLIPTFATFILCLGIGVEYGILVGVGINMVFLLYPSARPTMSVEKKISRHNVEYILITPGNSLYFPAIEFIKSSIGQAGLVSSHLPVVVDCRFILGADFTAAKGIAALINEFVSRKQPLYFLNPREEVITVFKGAVPDDFQYFASESDMDECLKIHKENQDLTEGSKLLQNIEEIGPIRYSMTELREIKCGENGTTSLNHRKTNDTG